MEPSLVLASRSRSRRRILEGAGLAFDCMPANVDEAEIKRSLRAERADAAQVAETLADLKADRVSRRLPGALVIGADQMLVCAERWFDKPADMAAAREQVSFLAGKRHALVGCACVVRDGHRLWHYPHQAWMSVRALSETEIDGYLARAGAGALESVGAYQLEGVGANLFDAVDGDFFSILGLPLLPLLGFLREHGVGIS